MGDETRLKKLLDESVRKILKEKGTPLKTYLETQKVLVELTLLKLNHGVSKKQVIDEEDGISLQAKASFRSLIKIINTGELVQDKEDAAKDLLQLLEDAPQSWVLFKSEAIISQLFSPLKLNTLAENPLLHEKIISIIRNISLHDEIKRIVLNPTKTIDVILESLKIGTHLTRLNATKTIFNLSENDPNKSKLGRFGGVQYLMDIIGGRHDPLDLKEVAVESLTRLCVLEENRVAVVMSKGGVRVIIDKISENTFVRALLSILCSLSTTTVGAFALQEYEAKVVPLMLGLIHQEDNEIREHCLSILYNTYSISLWRFDQAPDELKTEAANPDGIISRVAQNGSEKVTEKAVLLLSALANL